MKKFILKVAYFILTLIVLALILDYTISHILKQSDEYAGEFEVQNDIYSGKAKCEIAIYGSSRALVHVDPKIIEDTLNLSAYNFGIDGHGFWLQYLRHLEFLKYNAPPKMIIISTDAYSLEKKTDLFQQNQFLPYMLWNKNIREYTASFNGFTKMDYYVPLLRFFGKKSVLKSCLMVLFKKNSVKYREKGYKSVDDKWRDDLAKAKEQSDNYVVKVDSSSRDLFDKFMLECKSSNIKVIMVNTPEYIDGQEFMLNRKENLKIYKDLAIKYDLIFLDYSNSEICYNKDLFYNSMHLNSKGSILFSKILVSDIKNKYKIASLTLE